jgi:plastocyanin
MKKSLLLLATGILTACQLAGAADITGVITLKGTPPPEIPITPLKNDPVCGKMYQTMPTTHFYVVGSKGELADVVVYLKDVTGKSTGPSQPPAVLDQKGCLYTPQIMAVQTGQKIVVKNSDPCIHNVHCTPTVPGNPEHNDVQMAGGPDLTYSFPKPEMFLRFKCDVHPWMFAWVSVFDSPYFAVTDKDGKFTIKDVPPGKYTLVAAHRKLGNQSADIDVTAAGATHDFTFEVK